MTHLTLAVVAAGWLAVAGTALRARRGAHARGGPSRWHRAQDTLSRWSSDAAEVPVAATWCRPVVVPVQPRALDLPRQKSTVAEVELRLSSR